MGKELLEDAKDWHFNLVTALVTADLDEETKILTRKYKNLLKKLIEQAERAQELETEVNSLHWRNEWFKSEEQNKCYREAFGRIIQSEIDDAEEFADFAEQTAMTALESASDE